MNMHSETIAPRIDPQWERFPDICILGKAVPHGPHTLQKCGVLRSTRFLTLDQLPAPVPWTSYCLRLTPASRHTLNCTKPWVLFYSPTESHWYQTHLHGIKINNTDWDTFPGSSLTWSFSLHMHTVFPSHPSWSLMASYLVVFDFWGFKHIDLITALQTCKSHLKSVFTWLNTQFCTLNIQETVPLIRQLFIRGNSEED